MNSQKFAVTFFEASNLPLEIIATVLGITLICLFLFIYLYKRYERMKKNRHLQEEMEMLDFAGDEKTALFEIVQRNTLNEPVEVLYSLKLFDELAEEEIARILSSPMSSESKSKYVNMIYTIRKKTYFAHMDAAEPDLEAIPAH